LRIGPFYSSLIRQGHADFLLSLDDSETSNNRHFLKPDGVIVENSSLPDEPGVRRVNASELARRLGRVQMENVVLLGFASTVERFPISGDELRAQFNKERRKNVRTMNLRALEAGIRAAS